MMRSLAVLLPLAALSMGQFVSPPILTLGTPSNTTICGSVSINWEWTGSNLATTFIVTNLVPENEISTSQPVPPQPFTAQVGETIDLMTGSFIWQQAAVIRGWYAFRIFDQAVGGTVSQQSTSFFVEGQDVPTCTLVIETGTVGRGPTSDGAPTATSTPTPAPGGSSPNDDNSSSQSGGGINAGVIAGVVLGALAGIAIAAVLFFFLCRRRGRGFIRASRAFGKLDAEAKGNAARSGHGRWGGLGSVDVTTAANQAKAAAAAGAVGGAAVQKDFPFSSSPANGGSTAAQSKITLGDEKTENDDENPFKEPTVPSLHSHQSETLIDEESRVASPVSRTTSPRPAPPPPPARRGSILSSSSSSHDHGSAPNSPPLTAQRVGPRGPPPPITPRANRTNTGPKTPTLSPRTRTASLKEFVDQNQGYQMAAYSVSQDEQARYSRLSNMPALAHAVPTAIITTPPRPPSTIGLPLTQPRRKPAPVYDIEMKGKSESDSSASTSTSGLGLSVNGGTSGGNVSSATLGNVTGNGTALGSGTGIGLAADGDGPVHYLIPDLPPPQPKGR